MANNTLDTVRELQLKLYWAAKRSPSRRFHALFDKVCRQDVLWRAWVQVAAKGGAPGVDGVTIAQIEEQGVDGVRELLGGLAAELESGTYRPLPVRRVTIPKPAGGERHLGVPAVRDRIVQAAAKLVCEPVFEADFLDCSYGFRPRRSAHQALDAIRAEVNRGRTWVVDADIASFFDAIRPQVLRSALEERISDRRMLKLLMGWLRAGVWTGQSLIHPETGTAQGGVITPPTQQRTFAHVTLRVGGVVAAAATGWFPDRDAVADGEFVGSDEDVLDDGAQDALAVLGGGGGGAAAEPGEEALEVAGELQVGVAVGGLGVEGGDLVLDPGLAGAEGGHAGAELVDGQELLGERGDHRGDRRGGLREGLLELAAFLCDRVGCPCPLQPFIDLGADEGGVGEQGDQVVPDTLSA